MFFVILYFVCYLLYRTVTIHERISLENFALHSTSQKFRLLQLLYGPKIFILGNILFLILSILVAVNCCTSKSLFFFFKTSYYFEAWNFIDSVKNFSLTAVLLYYGMTLRGKILNLMRGYISRGDNNVDPMQSMLITKLADSVQKLILVMSLCIICFLLRTSILILKCTYRTNSMDNLIYFFQFLDLYIVRTCLYSTSKLIKIFQYSIMY